MKSCSKCGDVKDFSEFYKAARNADGYHSSCKACNRVIATSRRRTKEGLAFKKYQDQIQSSKIRGHQPPTYERYDLQNWLLNQPLFHELYATWVASGYDIMLVPSVDRINDDFGYTMENIQLMTWQENKDKAYRDRANGRPNKQTKAVIQFGLDGEFIASFQTIATAAKDTDAYRGGICDCCKGKLKTSGGSQWNYSVLK